ncbi:hypothetical protein LO762_02225 [Actinocorallia sp. API 0066]|uniref:hypothetical protein n=1 Tax=Actinocorallia sp. API 0066 TaxID=2896846 RepID=UPI001E6417C9|nr:hypothetical protein [Actinocorallia sp. API 0066]MCD0448018.1 hypothetical protein [Actinocorallia sp. API 0066]
MKIKEERMAHNDSCGRARQPGCKCACGGAKHGCQGGFEAAEGSRETVLIYVAERDRDWVRPPAGTSAAQAAIGCVLADVVHWLHRDRVLLDHTRGAQQRAFGGVADLPDFGLVLRVLEVHLEDGMKDFQKWALETHFWCELLAQLALTLTHYSKFKNTIAVTITKALLLRDSAPMPDSLNQSEITEMATHATWRYLLEGLIIAAGAYDPESLIWPVRVIAVFMCPDISRHPAVREHCVTPIVEEGRAKIRDEVRDRLVNAFPAGSWPSWP